jgi:hypothetical protein
MSATQKSEEVKAVKTVIPKSSYDILSAVAVIEGKPLEDYIGEILKERASVEQQAFKSFRNNVEAKRKP